MRKKKKAIPLKAIAKAIKSPLTPTPLKRGLIKKYGSQLRRKGYL